MVNLIERKRCQFIMHTQAVDSARDHDDDLHHTTHIHFSYTKVDPVGLC